MRVCECLTVDPPQDIEGGPLVGVRGQRVPLEPHPHSGVVWLLLSQTHRERERDRFVLTDLYLFDASLFTKLCLYVCTW